MERTRRAICGLLVLSACLGTASCERDPEGRPGALHVVAAPNASGAAHAELDGAAAKALRRHLAGSTSPGHVERVFYFTLRGKQPPVPLLARLEWTGDTAVLRPSVPLTPGQTYDVVVEGPALASGLARLSVPHTAPGVQAASPARIIALHPRLPELPANLLKFYVHFSRPMAEGALFQHARLLDGTGRQIPQAFREVELWADGHRRLTLWINPGRTKRALGLSESLGPVLEPERSYTLEIRAGLADQQGRPLAAAFRHRFRTTAADHAQPRIESWKLEPPAAGSRAPLRVRFPESLDHALASRVIAVGEESGLVVDGRGAAAADGRSWNWTPQSAWTAGEYMLTAGGDLEDLAGNSLFRPFETAVDEDRKPAAEPPRFERRFTVTP